MMLNFKTTSLKEFYVYRTMYVKNKMYHVYIYPTSYQETGKVML